VPNPAQNSSWMSIYDQALKGKMEGLMLSGMTAASIGPDSNQVQSALGKLKWLVIMDALPTTSSEFWRAPGADPSQIKTEVFMLPATHWIEKDGSFVNSGRWSQWKDQVLAIQDPKTNDPTGMGFYPNWSWSWPLNRRVMYNRASADLDGNAWDPSRPGITCDCSKWVGDVPDYPAPMNPHDPNAYLPFIMNGEGVGRLFSNGMVDGPFPEHYEPVESPVANPLHPNNSASPVAFLYDKAAGSPNRFGTPQEFPYIATSYRLTEHE